MYLAETSKKNVLGSIIVSQKLDSSFGFGGPVDRRDVPSYALIRPEYTGYKACNCL